MTTENQPQDIAAPDGFAGDPIDHDTQSEGIVARGDAPETEAPADAAGDGTADANDDQAVESPEDTDPVEADPEPDSESGPDAPEPADEPDPAEED